MAARVRNSGCQEDENLRADLVKYVRQNLRRKEILDLVQINYPMYAWSPRTLTRRLQYFGIQFTDYSVDIDDVREAVEEEIMVLAVYSATELCFRKSVKFMA